jgi:GTPase SAR1 family protein
MRTPNTAPPKKLTGTLLVAVVAVIVCLITLYFVVLSFELGTLLAFLAALVPATAAVNELLQQWRSDKGIRPAVSAAQQTSDRAAMLQNVRAYWINGMLRKSLFGAKTIDLDMQYSDQAVQALWDMPLRRYGNVEEPLPPGTAIDQVFAEAGRSLLVLGEPGSGKTTTLLRLTDKLLDRACADDSAPMPVVFNLSSWSPRFKSLADWMINELIVRYCVPSQVAPYWVREAMLTPLLDGLDEVSAANRDACLAAINAYRHEFGLKELVVTCRKAEYEELREKAVLPTAVEILPLSHEHVDAYLLAGGEQLKSVRTAVARDEGLQKLTQTPLFLSIVTQAYRNSGADDILGSGDEREVRWRLYNVYIYRMLQWRQETPLSDRRWLLLALHWLAGKMRQLSQSMFLFEELQPEWLVADSPSSTTASSYKAANNGPISPRLLLPAYLVLSRLAVAAVIGFVILISFVAGSYATTMLGGVEPFNGVGAAISLLMGTGVVLGTLAADSIRIRFEQQRGLKPIGVLYPILCVAAVGFSTLLIALPFTALTEALLLGLSNALLNGLLLGIRDRTRTVLREIKVVEKLRISPRKVISGFVPFLFLGVCVGLLMGQLRSVVSGPLAGEYLIPVVGFFRALMWGLIQHESNLNAAMGLIVGISGATTFALLIGLTGGTVRTQQKPNQGMRSSIFSSLFAGAIVAAVQGVFWGVIVWRNSWYAPAIIAAIVYGLLPGCLAALWHGGIDVIRHYTLRLLLIVQGYWPRRVVPYLDLAADNLLLRKVGGGYLFLHLSLLEHMAQVTRAKIEVLATSESTAQVNRLPYRQSP